MWNSSKVLSEDIQAAIFKACQEEQRLSLSGLTSEDLDEKYGPFDDLYLILLDALAEVRRIARHEHDWNDDDYCNVCHADGRA